MRTKTLIASVLLASLLVPPPVAHGTTSSRLAPFRGMGAWIDIYDPGAWRRPAQTINRLASQGVKTLYLQTTNYHKRGPIYYRTRTGQMLEAAHAKGMKVVSWYLPGFRNMRRDRRRSMAAIRFRSPNGHRFDGFGLDIEATIVRNVRRRNRRMLSLSRYIRQRVGPNYPLGAIIYSPYALKLRPSVWPAFPYKKVAAIYNAFLPMGYYSYRAQGAAAVTRYSRRTIDILREKTGVPNIPVHLIGGLADGSSASESRAFARVVREYGLLGGSIYDDSLMGSEDWTAVKELAYNPRQSPAMPLRPGIHTGAYGHSPDDQTHPAEVVYRIGARSEGLNLTFEGYDIGVDEVTVFVNWAAVQTLAPGIPGNWQPYTVAIPSSAFSSGSANVIAFVPSVREPPWTEWALRGASFTSSV